MAPREEDEWEEIEGPSRIAAVVRGINDYATFGHADEIVGWLESLTSDKSYTQARDEQRHIQQATAEAHPATYHGSGIAASFAVPAFGGAAGGLRGAAAAGALQGGLGGLGSSNADLVNGGEQDWRRAAIDTATGAGLGAAFGTAAHGAARGIQRAGQKAGDVLDSARKEMRGKVRGERAIEDEAMRAADLEAEVEMGKAQASAQKENKAFDDRRARELLKKAKEAQKTKESGAAARPQSPDDLSTKVLGGYHRQAYADVAERQLKGETFRKGMDEAPPAVAEDWQRYIDEFPEAMSDPALARRMVIERNLRMRYGDELAERVLAERFTPDGRVLSRADAAAARAQPTAPPAQRALPEPQQRLDLNNDMPTQAGEWEDLARVHGENPAMARELEGGPGRRNMGARAMGDDTQVQWNRDTVEQQGARSAPQRDPFHDANTRVGLVETTGNPQHLDEIARLEDELHAVDVRGAGDLYEAVAENLERVEAARIFRFRDRRTGRDFDIEAIENVDGDIDIQSIHPADMKGSHQAAWGEEANELGPRVLRQVLPDLARAFPNARHVGGLRVTGVHARRTPQYTWAPLPSVTEVSDPRAIRQAISQAERTSAGAPEFTQPSARRMAQMEPTNPGEPTFQDDGLPPLEELTQPGGPPAQGAQFDLPQMDEVTQQGAPSLPEPVQRFSPLSAPPARRDGGAMRGFGPRQPSASPPPPNTGDPTLALRGNRPATPAQEATHAADVPNIQRPARPDPGPVRVVRHDGATRYGPPPVEQRMAARPGVDEVVAQRERDAMLNVGLAGYEGARRAHNFVAAPIGAAMGITREAVRNPAVRARAISALKLQELQRVDPEVFARVSRTLEQARQKGETSYNATRHVLLQTTPAFREAERRVDEQLRGADEDGLVQLLQRSGVGGGF